MANELLIPSVGPIQNRTDIGAKDKLAKNGGVSFNQVLQGQLQEKSSAIDGSALSNSSLKFSAHAMSRLKDRSISMNKEQLTKLENAVDTANAKGAKESLILTSDAAFIVSIKNKTVITVLDRNAMNGNVFTNIDSTVVV